MKLKFHPYKFCAHARVCLCLCFCAHGKNQSVPLLLTRGPEVAILFPRCFTASAAYEEVQSELVNQFRSSLWCARRHRQTRAQAHARFKGAVTSLTLGYARCAVSLWLRQLRQQCLKKNYVALFPSIYLPRLCIYDFTLFMFLWALVIYLTTKIFN